MITLQFIPSLYTEQEFKVKGPTFGHAAYELVGELCARYYEDVFTDGRIFKALAEIQEKDDLIYEHSDMSCPEDNFTLTMIEE